MDNNILQLVYFVANDRAVHYNETVYVQNVITTVIADQCPSHIIRDLRFTFYFPLIMYDHLLKHATFYFDVLVLLVSTRTAKRINGCPLCQTLTNPFH